MEDEMGAVLADVGELFRYDRDRTYQERCHAYLKGRGVRRGVDDTAVQRVVTDLVERAAASRSRGGLDDEMLDAAEGLIALARKLRGGAR